jgi:hypothetical protein
MSSRRKRPKRLLEDDVASFVADATAMHETVLSYQDKVRVGCDHYDALWKLHDAILTALRDITGEDVPPWAKTTPGFSGQLAMHAKEGDRE